MQPFIDLINSFGFTGVDWLVTLLCGFLIGTSKAGVAGAGLIIVPIMAVTFGGKLSTGIVLPMLIIADVFAVKHYHKHANWKYIVKVTPWALLGIILAVYVGHSIDDATFKTIISISVIVGIGIMIWRDLKKSVTIPDYWWFAMVLGSLGGFASMIGNTAGPIMSLYLLSMRIPKNVFIATAAWFFFLINLFKVPLHIVYWETINTKTLVFNLLVAPSIILGVFLGIQLVKILPEKVYRILVIGTAAISAVSLL